MRSGVPPGGTKAEPWSSALPLRPLTVGELLDAALALLRTRARPLLLLGLALAAVEQAVLYPLRRLAQPTTPVYLPTEGHLGQWWVLIAAGLGTEALAIAVLGGLAASAALPALLGRPLARPPRSRASMALSIGAVAAVAAIACAVGAFLFLVPWVVVYAFVGLAAPAVVVDRLGPGRALLRSVRLVSRSWLRPGVIRVLGYLGWLFFRLALGVGGLAVLSLVRNLNPDAWEPFASSVIWGLVNAMAYPVLGCLDAVLHLETRMRVEGLDIALGRAMRRGEPLEPALAVPR